MKDPCAHCRKVRAVHFRGLCRRCYQKPGVRECYPDGRCRPSPTDPASVDDRNRVVLSIDYGLVRASAVAVAKKFGPRVDADDLAQSAYLRIIRAAEVLRCRANPAAGLWAAVRVAIREEMRRVGVRATRERLYGSFTGREHEQLVEMGLLGGAA